ncbi:MAG: hypothetical protein QOK49_1054 [Baekduia sp.]|jgi:hypothetical protein|nr:hypothetical protein [Baekduia sp.]
MSRCRLPFILSLGLALGVLATPARAAFDPPTELAHGSYSTSFAQATDAAGTTTALLTAVGAAPQLLTRTASGPWSPLAALPAGTAGAVGPVAAAAGNGALALAWRVDRPHKYDGVAAAVRDPGGVLGAPATIAGPGDDGVRHPAVAVDADGGAVLAYNIGTRSSHDSNRGGVALALRAPGLPFRSAVTLQTERAQAPAVALAPDGHGLVAWTRSGTVFAVSVDVNAGRVGAVRKLTSPGSHNALRVAAGPGGAATMAWQGRRTIGKGKRQHTQYGVGVAWRGAGERFGRPALIGAGDDYVRDVALAADEDGRATVAWARATFGDDRRLGYNGVTSAIVAATAASGHAFGAPQVVKPRSTTLCGTPSIAAASGRVALAWSCVAQRWPGGIQVALGAPAPGRPQTVTPLAALRDRSGLPGPKTTATLDAHGTATVLYQLSDPAGPAAGTNTDQVLATRGR